MIQIQIRKNSLDRWFMTVPKCLAYSRVWGQTRRDQHQGLTRTWCYWLPPPNLASAPLLPESRTAWRWRTSRGTSSNWPRSERGKYNNESEKEHVLPCTGLVYCYNHEAEDVEHWKADPRIQVPRQWQMCREVHSYYFWRFLRKKQIISNVLILCTPALRCTFLEDSG